LVDHGANGGIGGSDIHVIYKTHHSVDIQGINNHQMVDIPIATVGGVISTQCGEVIDILHQYTYTGIGTSIHSLAQLEWYKNNANDKSIKVGGLQCITTLEGYVILLNIVQGLPRMTICPSLDQEWDNLPHVILTSKLDWDPSQLDLALEDDDKWFDSNLEGDPFTNLFDEFGNYCHDVIVQSTSTAPQVLISGNSHLNIHLLAGLKSGNQVPISSNSHLNIQLLERLRPNIQILLSGNPQGIFQPLQNEIDDILDCCTYAAQNHTMAPEAGSSNEPQATPVTLTVKEQEYQALWPLFGWLSTDIIKRTFKVTTQYAHIPTSTILKKHFKSPNPALNVHCRNESVATDTVYSDTPAIDSGVTVALFFVGCNSMVCDIYGIKTDKQFVNTLEDHICEHGAPYKIISDRAQVEISENVQDILCTLFIGSWQSEPHQQHQNPAECRIQTVKTTANTILDCSGAPALLCLLYICFLLNHTYCVAINCVPLQHVTGSTVDISPLLRFHFWEQVYYKVDDSDFPSESHEALGHMVGIAESVGHAMTYKVLTADTQKIIYYSNLCSASSEDPNWHVTLLGGEPSPQPAPPDVIKSCHDDADGEPKDHNMPVFSPLDLVGHTFLLEPHEDGQCFCAHIVKAIKDHENNLAQHPEHLKFLCSINDDTVKEIMSYNDILAHIHRDEESSIVD